MEIIRKEGKLLNLNIEISEGIIRDIRIRGDFFAIPAESISHLEKELMGTADTQWENIINDIFEKSQIVGFTKDGLLSALREAR